MTQKFAIKLLFYLAATGWVLALIVHLASLANLDVEDKIPAVWILHIGIFIVLLPTRFISDDKFTLDIFQSVTPSRRKSIFNIVFNETPIWFTNIVIFSFLYTVINLALFMASQTGSPDVVNGKYVLRSHGRFIKALTEKEYHYYKAKELKCFSALWGSFYGLVVAELYPIIKPANIDAKQD